MWTALATTCVTSTMFLTALDPTLLALSILAVRWVEIDAGSVAAIGAVLGSRPIDFRLVA